MITFKKCSTCGLNKAYTEYYAKYARCKDCTLAKHREHKSVVRHGGRVPAERCEVCGSKARVRARNHTVTFYDHNHDTGEFRGWLCGLCNFALGNAGDNPHILDRLATYLRERGCAPTRPVIS